MEYYAFDLDETLFVNDRSLLKIYVANSLGERINTLSHQEFSLYKLAPGEAYDFSEFTSSDIFCSTAKPIRPMIDLMLYYRIMTPHVEIVTARSDMDDQVKFSKHLAKYGIDVGKIHVRRAGNIGNYAPRTKKIIIGDLVVKNKFKVVHLYDDSQKNLDAFMTLRNDHPGVEFHAHRVHYEAMTGELEITSLSS